MFRQLPPFSSSSARRRGDHRSTSPTVEVRVSVEFDSLDEASLSAEASSCLARKMDLVEYGREVSVQLKALTNALQVVSAQRVLKVHKFREMLEHLDGLKKFMDDIVITTHETKLISLNTLISASRCGLKGQSLAFV
ncbi:MAG: hypothetical protein P8104_09105, partial [Gammaproteobacteria bacterium]